MPFAVRCEVARQLEAIQESGIIRKTFKEPLVKPGSNGKET